MCYRAQREAAKQARAQQAKQAAAAAAKAQEEERARQAALDAAAQAAFYLLDPADDLEEGDCISGMQNMGSDFEMGQEEAHGREEVMLPAEVAADKVCLLLYLVTFFTCL